MCLTQMVTNWNYLKKKALDNKRLKTLMMGLSAHPDDTHQAVKAITRSGLDDTQAEAIVTTIHKAMHQGLATKSDFVALNADVVTLKTDVVTLKTDVATLKSDMKGVYSDIVSLKGDMLVLKWMVGLVIAVEALPFLKFFFA